MQINSPDVDLTHGLVALPAQVVDVTGLAAQSCLASGSPIAAVIGHGGLPPNPSNSLGSEAVLVDWTTLEKPGVENRSSAEATTNAPTKENATIVEAQEWEIDPQGEVVFTAQTHSVTPHSLGLAPASCHGL